jgi:ABC-type protease/lipase transport system fused ATPase/permease subunit
MVALIAQWRTVVGARDAWERLAKLLATIPARAQAMALPAPGSRFAAGNLVVTAPGGKAPVLRGVSFALQAGEVLAVIGPTVSVVRLRALAGELTDASIDEANRWLVATPAAKQPLAIVDDGLRLKLTHMAAR